LAQILTNQAEICVAVLAHNEEGRIIRCMNSLPLDAPNVAVHIVINGSTDQTEPLARALAAKHTNVTVHSLAEGGKSRSWNRFMFDLLPQPFAYHIFVDGDAEIKAGSVAAMVALLQGPEQPNAVSGIPLNGRRAGFYQQAMRDEHGMFGDLYGLSGSFLNRMKAAGIRLPTDLIGDDGLLCAMAKTDLANEHNWCDDRVLVCDEAGFICDPVNWLRPASWRLQYRRMISYSIRHFQNAMVSKIMRGPGPGGLPESLAQIASAELPHYAPRRSFPEYWFDRIALKRLAKAAGR
jgi:glycosyltransferase involved in cell wall biosynthesis